MKTLLKTIQYFYILLRSKLAKEHPRFKTYPADEIEKRERKNRFKSAISTVLGTLYYKYNSLKERDRIWTFKAEKEIQRHGILLELLKHAKTLIFYLGISLIISLLVDWLFSLSLPLLRANGFLVHYFSLPSLDFMGLGLEIFVGAISAVLGLIFALYTIGFQLATDRYSEKVTDFINQESVSNYFFGLLIFTDLFSLITLLRLHFFSLAPVISFLIAGILVMVSLLGILIFKSHYTNTLKPINLFQSLWRLCLEQLDIATNISNYKYKSWSLVIHARDNSNRYLNIFGNLYRDLIRAGNWNDAIFAPLILGELLRDYSDVKKFVNQERGWWFFQNYEKVKADDMVMFTLKANYELQGRGPLHIPKSAKDWYENKIYEYLDEMLDDSDSDNTNKLIPNISSAYARILVGDYKKQIDAPPKLIPGAIHNQEFDMFDKGFERFLNLWKKVDFSKETIAAEFTNNYFAIAIGILEEWSIERVSEIAHTFYEGNQLNRSQDFSLLKELPAFSRATLIDYWQRLEVEQEVEGLIMTPSDKLINETENVLKEKRQEIITKYLTKLFDNCDEIILHLFKGGQLELAGQFIKMQCEWISRLLYIKENALAEKFAPRLLKKAAYILYLPKATILDLELLEQAEKGYFVSLIERKKGLFESYSKISIIVMLMLRDKEDNQDNLVNLLRLPVLWGTLAFLVSELDQNPYYISTFIKQLEKTYREGWMAQIIETAADLNLTKNIYRETTRYHSWYRTVLNEMAHTLRKTPIREVGELGFQEGYDHPSKFIQKLGTWELMAEEICMEEFVEWVKKREEIKKLVSILVQVGGQKDE
ncbi:hypothetical protein A2115_03555 [Candidatus Woesebacteria bacterium GWA1_41_8]|uniref:Uncharacterized protein n=1 Tax=Candidatus Woesebacteria bacterium GWA1_41_8 TaxID=1802471 RepID=A0A1F7WIQ5_9BACT|nr:MAG: hypothetical protein A2115_03555 [Candidatus Woesebacteria bacterium GWA1_41_8]